MLHFRLKKRGEITPYEKVGSLLGDIEKEAPTIPPWRLRKPEIELTPPLQLTTLEDAGNKGEDRGSPGEFHQFYGCQGQQGRDRDIYASETSECQPQDVKSQLHKFDRTCGH